MQPRVRNLEAGLVDLLLPVKQEVEVERARALFRGGEAVAPECPLQLEHGAEQAAGREGGLELDGAVQESRLVDVADGLGVPQRRDLQDRGLGQVPEASAGLAQLRRARAVVVAEPERLLPKAGVATQATDPLVPAEWWRPAIGADRADAPGPGKPVTIVDSGLDVTHPEFASRPNTIVVNKQTVSDEDEDHGTEVASVIGAPNNGFGVVGVYPEAILRVWDASPFGILNEGSAIQGI